MVAFLEANEMLWDKKATHYRRPDLKNDEKIGHIQVVVGKRFRVGEA